MYIGSWYIGASTVLRRGNKFLAVCTLILDFLIGVIPVTITIKYFPDGAVISNSARGDMIDDEAMVQALINRRIYAIGLDVYNGEPEIHPGYLNLPNAFILPHLGSATKKTRTAMADLAISNIEEYFERGSCKNKVN